MPQIATFIDTNRQNIGAAAAALVKDGWQKVPNTKDNRRTILLKYYEYLVNTNAKIAGINPAMLTPAQLEPVWAKANAEYERYEMYVKNVVHVSASMVMEGAPMPVEEHFATVNEVERMQPGYVDIDDLLAGFGQMGIFGGKRRKHHGTKRHHKKFHKRHTKRRHTRRN